MPKRSARKANASAKATTTAAALAAAGVPGYAEPFARAGHYFVVDNAILDRVVPAISNAAWAVLSVVLRHTNGYRRNDAALSVKELMALTGLHEGAVVKALKVLTSPLPQISDPAYGGLLLRSRASVAAPTTYALNRAFRLTDGRPRKIGR